MDDLVRRYGQFLLVLVGLALLTVATVTDRAVVLIVTGGGLLVVGVIADRIEGPLKVGPGGVETVLRPRALEEAKGRGLDGGGAEASPRGRED